MKQIQHYRNVISRYCAVFGPLGLFYLFAAAAFKVRWIVPVSSKWTEGRDIFLRLGSSDILVFDQVFIDEEYQVTDQLPDTHGAILDAGANIGLTSIYLSRRHPGRRIYAIEPDNQNFALLKLNVSGIPNVFPHNLAIWGERTDRLFIPRNDASEWARQTMTETSSNAQEVRAARIDDFMAENLIDRISILKLDVEGAEHNIFSVAPESWLECVESIVVELHESIAPGCSAVFNNAIAGSFHEVALTRELTVVSRHASAAAVADA